MFIVASEHSVNAAANRPSETVICGCYVGVTGALSVRVHRPFTLKLPERMVGAAGIEPATPTMST